MKNAVSPWKEAPFHCIDLQPGFQSTLQIRKAVVGFLEITYLYL